MKKESVTKADIIVQASAQVIKKGSTIIHPKFGKGTVVSVKDTIVNVKFANETRSLNYKWLIEHNTVK